MNRLRITGCTATTDTEHGIRAALAVFDRWKLTPEHCARQVQARAEGDAWGQRGVAAWEEAEAAVQAACGGRLEVAP